MHGSCKYFSNALKKIILFWFHLCSLDHNTYDLAAIPAHICVQPCQGFFSTEDRVNTQWASFIKLHRNKFV